MAIEFKTTPQLISARVPSLGEARQAVRKLVFPSKAIPTPAELEFPSPEELAKREEPAAPLLTFAKNNRGALRDFGIIGKIMSDCHSMMKYELMPRRRKLISAILGEEELPEPFYVRLNQLAMQGHTLDIGESKVSLKRLRGNLYRAMQKKNIPSILQSLEKLASFIKEQWREFNPNAEIREYIPPIVSTVPERPVATQVQAATKPASTAVKPTIAKKSQSTRAASRTSTTSTEDVTLGIRFNGDENDFDTWDGED